MSLNRQLAVALALLLVTAGGALWLRALEQAAKRDFFRQANDAQFCSSELSSCQGRVKW